MRKKTRILLVKSLHEMIKPHIRQAIKPENIRMKYDSMPVQVIICKNNQYACIVRSDGDSISIHGLVDVYNYCINCQSDIFKRYSLCDPQCGYFLNYYLDNMVCFNVYNKLAKNLRKSGFTVGRPYRANNGVIFEVCYIFNRLNLLLDNDGSIKAHDASYNSCRTITDYAIDYIKSHLVP